ncbi:MAG: hypothetical protein R2695_17215 [Acidimicrobiales bacterium]
MLGLVGDDQRLRPVVERVVRRIEHDRADGVTDLGGAELERV